MTKDGDAIFREVQRFGKWFYLMLIATVGGSAAAVYISLSHEKAVSGALFIFIVVAVVMAAALSAFLLMLRLETEVRGDGLYIRFYPFHRSFKRYTKEDLQGYYFCQYRPIQDYGGWGVRYSSKGKAYNVSGSEGIQLVLASGMHLLIGSQRAQELAEAIDSIT
jgi:hypothetical protein